MRTIKFRAWDGEKMHDARNGSNFYTELTGQGLLLALDHHNHGKTLNLMQFTGLLDKNAGQEVYEGDIIDSNGNIKGNTYEMDAEETDLVIKGFGTATWAKTEMAGLGRGLRYAE